MSFELFCSASLYSFINLFIVLTLAQWSLTSWSGTKPRCYFTTKSSIQIAGMISLTQRLTCLLGPLINHGYVPIYVVYFSVLSACFCFLQAGTLALRASCQSETLGTLHNPMSNWSNYNLVICKQTFTHRLDCVWPRAAPSECLHLAAFWKCKTVHVQVCDTVFKVKGFVHQHVHILHQPTASQNHTDGITF